MPTALRIGQVARLTGITASAIRFYEDEGLLRPTRTESGYRLYEEEAISRLQFIRRAKALGLSLADIAEILRTPDVATEREMMRHRIVHRLADVRRQAEELRTLERSLTRLYLQVGRTDCGCRHIHDCNCAGATPTPREVSEVAAETAAVQACACGCSAGAVAV